MPIYEYRCSSCGHELEALQKFSDAPLVACPACAQDALVKLVSAAGFQLKGSGWYATDFKGSGAKPAAKGDGAETKNSDAKSEGKAGDKPADDKSASTPAKPSTTNAGPAAS
jgi:putative FmdB family regulatory protein